ncbi:hypothetical protein OAS39_10560 [Pirellulales bacterium]|nr:hypothetical protein [Pirellulales bacterium]
MRSQPASYEGDGSKLMSDLRGEIVNNAHRPVEDVIGPAATTGAKRRRAKAKAAKATAAPASRQPTRLELVGNTLVEMLPDGSFFWQGVKLHSYRELLEAKQIARKARRRKLREQVVALAF